jgi:hypothetical protein
MYSRHIHPFVPILPMKRLRAEDTTTSRFLLSSMCAIAGQVNAASPSVDHTAVCRTLSEEARQDPNQHTLQTVQAMLILTHLEYGLGRGPSARARLRSACDIVSSLSLHLTGGVGPNGETVDEDWREEFRWTCRECWALDIMLQVSLGDSSSVLDGVIMEMIALPEALGEVSWEMSPENKYRERSSLGYWVISPRPNPCAYGHAPCSGKA